jgi:non-ribosomal peptide synthase protein (TIGR01720 family)
VSPTWSASAQGSLRELIRSVKEELRTVPHNGIGYGVLRHLAADTALLALAEPTDILFNYLGQFDSVFHETKAFSAASEHTGADVGPNLRRTHKLVIKECQNAGPPVNHQ